MKKLLICVLSVLIFIFAGCSAEKPAPKTPAPQEPEPVEEPSAPVEEPADDDLVVISDYIPDIKVDLKYATEENFTGKVIYESDVAYLRYGTVKKLMNAQHLLGQKGMRLVIWDAYRPKEAQFKLWEICPDPTFVANPQNGFSSHSRGNTVDITVVDENGKEIPMPSAFDDFSLKADRVYTDVTKEAGENSKILEDIMKESGFSGYTKEWWHYTDTTDYPVIS